MWLYSAKKYFSFAERKNVLGLLVEGGSVWKHIIVKPKPP